MRIDEYIKLSAFQISQAVASGELDPEEPLETALSISKKVNPHINAIVIWMEDEAKKLVKNLKENLKKEKENLKVERKLLLAGVPTLLKDLEQAYEGVRMTNGSKLLADFVPTYTSEFVKLIIDEGAVIFGKTNTPEFGLLNYTDPKIFGPSKNPWNTNLTPGGSSGGSACAVASCMVPVATGSDGGGSIRIPSAYTGVLGLKVSRGRTPSGPPFGELWQGFAINFFIARYAEDLALCLDATAKDTPSKPFLIQKNVSSWLEDLLEKLFELKNLRVAFTTRSPTDTPVSKFYSEAVLKVVRELEREGVQVEEREPDGWGWDVFEIFLAMYYSEVSATVSFLKETFGNKVFDELEETTLYLYSVGKHFGADEWIRATWKRYILTYNLAKFFEKYDLFLTPTVAFEPARVGELQPTSLEKSLMKLSAKFNLGWLLRKVKFLREFTRQLEIQNFQRTPFTQYANITGVPAISIPVFFDNRNFRKGDESFGEVDKNFPSAVQFIAPFGREDLLLAVAKHFQEKYCWYEKLPPPYIRKILFEGS